MLHIPLELILQLLYLSILYIDQLSQSIELCLEFLILRAHVFSQMADLVIEPLLELIVYYLYLPILLLHHVQEVLSILLNNTLQPNYLVIFLFLCALVLLEHSIING